MSAKDGEELSLDIGGAGESALMMSSAFDEMSATTLREARAHCPSQTSPRPCSQSLSLSLALDDAESVLSRLDSLSLSLSLSLSPPSSPLGAVRSEKGDEDGERESEEDGEEEEMDAQQERLLLLWGGASVSVLSLTLSPSHRADLDPLCGDEEETYVSLSQFTKSVFSPAPFTEDENEGEREGEGEREYASALAVLCEREWSVRDALEGCQERCWEGVRDVVEWVRREVKDRNWDWDDFCSKEVSVTPAEIISIAALSGAVLALSTALLYCALL